MSVGSKVLIVDAGNTKVKFTSFCGDKVLWVFQDSMDFDYDDFVPDDIYFASVCSDEQNEVLLNYVTSLFPMACVTILTSRSKSCGVLNAYSEPHRLGVDRWLAVVGAYHLFKDNIVVVDAGTAIKVDMVSKKGVHLGGYISPGLVMMESALLSKTARIKYEPHEVNKGVGLPNSTARAVSEGCYEMVLGFLSRIYSQYSHYRWLVTGGDACSLIQSLGIPVEYLPNLVALGAKLVGDEQNKRR